MKTNLDKLYYNQVFIFKTYVITGLIYEYTGYFDGFFHYRDYFHLQKMYITKKQNEVFVIGLHAIDELIQLRTDFNLFKNARIVGRAIDIEMYECNNDYFSYILTL